MSEIENDHFARGAEYGIRFAAREFMSSVIYLKDYDAICYKITQCLLKELKRQEKENAKYGVNGIHAHGS